MNQNFAISIDGHVLIKDLKTNTILLDSHNAIHSQNMARVIARALAHEENSYIWRVGLGNGGTTYSVDGSIIFKSPNDGSDGSGWESRLYNETYSEIVDDTSSLVGTDPGSADANNIRPGGGASPLDDPTPNSVVSQEVGTKSNVIITMYLNENEPASELASMNDQSQNPADLYFDFNELGIFSGTKQARDFSGYSSVNVGNKKASDVSTLATNTQYNMALNIDGLDHYHVHLVHH
jgi:hypothetical protein